MPFSTNPGLSGTAIRGQLARITASRTFETVAHQATVLSFIVEKSLAGRSDQLKGSVIASLYYRDDKGVGDEDRMRSEIGRLRARLKAYYYDEGGADSIRIEIPTGAYVATFSIAESHQSTARAANPIASGKASDLKGQYATLDWAEKTYYAYRKESPLVVDSPEVVTHLEGRYKCEAVQLFGKKFPATTIWQNKDEIIHPDVILGNVDRANATRLDQSFIWGPSEYMAARSFTKDVYETGEIKEEFRNYRMINFDNLTGQPTINAAIGYYYDYVLTQLTIEWELRKALMNLGTSAINRFHEPGSLPFREALESVACNPIYNGRGGCASIAVSTLVVFGRRRPDGFYCLLRRRSEATGISLGMLHVVPSGMFEEKDPESWSIEMNVWRELLEEAYNEKEQIGTANPEEQDYLRSKQPIKLLMDMIDAGSAELSVTGICCDLLNFTPEICTILFVKDHKFFDERKVDYNWEYDRRDWEDQKKKIGVVAWKDVELVVREASGNGGGVVAPGAACLSLGREWLHRRHGL